MDDDDDEDCGNQEDPEDECEYAAPDSNAVIAYDLFGDDDDEDDDDDDELDSDPVVVAVSEIPYAEVCVPFIRVLQELIQRRSTMTMF